MLSHDEVVRKLYGEVDEETVCEYCRFTSDCPKGVRNYGDGPTFPPCVELPAADYFNLEDYLDSKEE